MLTAFIMAGFFLKKIYQKNNTAKKKAKNINKKKNLCDNVYVGKIFLKTGIKLINIGGKNPNKLLLLLYLFKKKKVKQQMYGKNPEVLVRMFGPNRFTLDEMNRLSLEKEKQYQVEFLPHLKLLPGLNEFLEAAYQRDIPMAIGSAALPFNIDYVLDN